MAKEKITITQADFDNAYEDAADFLSSALADSNTPMSKAAMHLFVAATVSAHIKHILFREGESDGGN